MRASFLKPLIQHVASVAFAAFKENAQEKNVNVWSHEYAEYAFQRNRVVKAQQKNCVRAIVAAVSDKMGDHYRHDLLQFFLDVRVYTDHPERFILPGEKCEVLVRLMASVGVILQTTDTGLPLIYDMDRTDYVIVRRSCKHLEAWMRIRKPNLQLKTPQISADMAEYNDWLHTDDEEELEMPVDTETKEEQNRYVMQCVFKAVHEVTGVQGIATLYDRMHTLVLAFFGGNAHLNECFMYMSYLSSNWYMNDRFVARDYDVHLRNQMAEFAETYIPNQPFDQQAFPPWTFDTKPKVMHRFTQGESKERRDQKIKENASRQAWNDRLKEEESIDKADIEFTAKTLKKHSDERKRVKKFISQVKNGLDEWLDRTYTDAGAADLMQVISDALGEQRYHPNHATLFFNAAARHPDITKLFNVLDEREPRTRDAGKHTWMTRHLGRLAFLPEYTDIMDAVHSRATNAVQLADEAFTKWFESQLGYLDVLT